MLKQRDENGNYGTKIYATKTFFISCINLEILMSKDGKKNPVVC